MTKISYIHGIGNESQDRASLVPEQNLINTSSWTEGETRLALLAEQMNILSSYYPENGELKKAKEILVDTLYKGVHTTTLPTGIHTGAIATVVKEIRQARSKTGPANNLALYNRASIAKGIGDPLVPLSDCMSLLNTEVELIEYEGGAYQQAAPSTPAQQAAYQACVKENKWRQMLNIHLEKSAHHLLYEFNGSVNTLPNVAAIKTVNHRNGKALITQLSKISGENIRLWMRNGVIRTNAQNGLSPLQPEQAIALMRENPDGPSVEDSIGFIDPVTLTAIVSLISILVGAALEAYRLSKAAKQQAPNTISDWDRLQGIGTVTWGPDTHDWYTQGGSGVDQGVLAGQDIQSILPYILLATGGYLILK